MQRTGFGVAAILMLVVVLDCSSADTQTVPTTGQWNRFERAVTNARSYANPYDDVTLTVTYTRPDGSSVAFWGFYDGGSTWRIRFMPDQLGRWQYQATFSDGTPGVSGAFDCVESTTPGMLSQDETNPIWFGFKGGGHVLLRSFHVGDRFFAANWSNTSRTAFLDWLGSQGYNMLSVASHYLNRNESGRGAGWDTPDLWPLDAAEYRKLETILNDLAARRVMVYPFAGFFGQDSDYPHSRADQTRYIKYALARLGPYWNILLNVGGPETNLYLSSTDVNRLGQEIQSYNVFGHPLSVHSSDGDDPYRQSTWSSYVTLQGPETTSQSVLSAELLQNHTGAKPVYAQETMWAGNSLQPAYSDTTIRKHAWVINMSAATLNFADMNGNSSSGFSGSMDLATKVQTRHDIVKMVWDFLDTIPFYRMKPRQDLVSTGYALAEPGQQYLVYLPSRGTVDVTVSTGTYNVQWINGQNPRDVRTAGTTTTGRNLTTPAAGDDWVLYLTLFDASGNQPPVARIVAPADGAVFSESAAITIHAEAADADGTIAAVEFLSGSTTLSEDASGPFTFTWHDVPPGSYSLRVAATDDQGATAMSEPVHVTVAGAASTLQVESFTLIDADTDQPIAAYDPMMNGGQINLDRLPTRNLNIRANTRPDTVGSVRFTLNGAVYRTESGHPYALAGGAGDNYYAWTPAPGSYAVTATPYTEANAAGAAGTARTISFTVTDGNSSNGHPTVQITTPTADSTFETPATIAILADARDSDGTVQRVEFFQGTTKIGEDAASPFEMTWRGVPAGTYHLGARALDDDGAVGTSDAVLIYVRAANSAPSVQITSPANAASFEAPATFSIVADARDADGALTKVEFLEGGTKIGEATSAPFQLTLSQVAAGNYSFTARAIDDIGAATTSPQVLVNVANSSGDTSGSGTDQLYLVSFTLIDADTDAPIPGYDPIADGAILDLAALPGRNLNIRADTSPALVGSVEFVLNGTVYRTENTAPYSLAGDVNGNYYGWSPARGEYVLTATPFQGRDASGTHGASLTVRFSVR